MNQGGSESLGRCRECGGDALFTAVEVSNRSIDSETYLCENHAAAFFESYKPKDVTSPPVVPAGSSLFELRLMMFNTTTWLTDLYLISSRGKQYVRLRTGLFEGSAIRQILKERGRHLPLTHVAMKEIIDALGARVNSAVVYDYEPGNQLFRSRLLVDHATLAKPIEMRPSDALAICILANAPFVVAAEVVERLPKKGQREE